MRKIKTFIENLYIIEFDLFIDNRGWFCESYNKDKFNQLGFNYNFVQDNHSQSKKNVIRGLHFQSEPGQAKLIKCTKGKILDIAVDIRKNSFTFKKWFGIELSENDNKMLMVPIGFAHGFSVLSKYAEVQYKCSSVYNPITEHGFKYNDEEININWKIKNSIISDRDKNMPSFKEILSKINF